VTFHPLFKSECFRHWRVSFLASNAFAFGELLFFEGLQRKVTAPPKDPAALLPGAPPRAGTLGCDVELQTLSPLASYFSLIAPKEK
jgi:hypothetical protein